MFEDEIHKIVPEQRLWLLMVLYNGEESIHTEEILKERFGERWNAISNGRDRYFTATPYNF